MWLWVYMCVRPNWMTPLLEKPESDVLTKTVCFEAAVSIQQKAYLHMVLTYGND